MSLGNEIIGWVLVEMGFMPLGVLVGCFGRKIDGDSWFTRWFSHPPGISIYFQPKRDTYVYAPLRDYGFNALGPRGQNRHRKTRSAKGIPPTSPSQLPFLLPFLFRLGGNPPTKNRLQKKVGTNLFKPLCWRT